MLSATAADDVDILSMPRLATMPLMFALAGVLVIALVMALVDCLRTEPLLAFLARAAEWENRLARHLHTKRQ